MSDNDLSARIAKLEARVEELENEREIRNLLSRYGYNADCCRDDEYVDLYTEDGIMNLASGGDDVRRYEGKERLRQFITDPNGHSKPGYYGKSMHMQGNNVVTHINKDEAIVNSYSVVLVGDGTSRPELYTAGNNQWSLKKVDGRWHIKERRRRNLGDKYYVDNLDATPA